MNRLPILPALLAGCNKQPTFSTENQTLRHKCARLSTKDENTHSCPVTIYNTIIYVDLAVQKKYMLEYISNMILKIASGTQSKLSGVLQTCNSTNKRVSLYKFHFLGTVLLYCERTLLPVEGPHIIFRFHYQGCCYPKVYLA